MDTNLVKCFLSCLLLVGMGQVACAAEWKPYAWGPSGDIAYLDMSSIKASGNKRTAWSKLEYKTAIDYEGHLLSKYVANIEVSCDGRTARRISEVGYQADGTVLYEFTAIEHSSPVPPETMGDLRLEAMCKYPLRKRL